MHPFYDLLTTNIFPQVRQVGLKSLTGRVHPRAIVSFPTPDLVG